MNAPAALMIGFGLVAIAALFFATRADAAALASAPDSPADETEALPASVPGALARTIEQLSEVFTMSTWTLPAAGEPYRALIEAAEAANGIPSLMLARLLYQESHFRPDIITGRTKSPAGALGIAQFMPATAAELGIDPLNPAQAVPAAGRYLARLYATFGAWPEALAAYNWGQGNVSRKGLAAAPAETRAYVAGILGDLGYA